MLSPNLNDPNGERQAGNKQAMENENLGKQGDTSQKCSCDTKCEHEQSKNKHAHMLPGVGH